MTATGIINVSQGSEPESQSQYLPNKMSGCVEESKFDSRQKQRVSQSKQNIINLWAMPSFQQNPPGTQQYGQTSYLGMTNMMNQTTAGRQIH